MADVAAPAAPTEVATPVPQAKPAEGPRPLERPFLFTIQKGPEFSLDNLLTQGYVQAVIQISPSFSASFRNMSVDQIQTVESLANPREDSKTMKYVMNQMSIGQIYFSLVAINGIRGIQAAPELSDRMTDKDARWKWVRGLAGPIFDQLLLALNEFDRHAKALVSPENLKNF